MFLFCQKCTLKYLNYKTCSKGTCYLKIINRISNFWSKVVKIKPKVRWIMKIILICIWIYQSLFNHLSNNISITEFCITIIIISLMKISKEDRNAAYLNFILRFVYLFYFTAMCTPFSKLKIFLHLFVTFNGVNVRPFYSKYDCIASTFSVRLSICMKELKMGWHV